MPNRIADGRHVLDTLTIVTGDTAGVAGSPFSEVKHYFQENLNDSTDDQIIMLLDVKQLFRFFEKFEDFAANASKRDIFDTTIIFATKLGILSGCGVIEKSLESEYLDYAKKLLAEVPSLFNKNNIQTQLIILITLSQWYEQKLQGQFESVKKLYFSTIESLVKKASANLFRDDLLMNDVKEAAPALARFLVNNPEIQKECSKQFIEQSKEFFSSHWFRKERSKIIALIFQSWELLRSELTKEDIDWLKNAILPPQQSHQSFVSLNAGFLLFFMGFFLGLWQICFATNPRADVRRAVKYIEEATFDPVRTELTRKYVGQFGASDFSELQDYSQSIDTNFYIFVFASMMTFLMGLEYFARGYYNALFQNSNDKTSLAELPDWVNELEKTLTRKVSFSKEL